VVPLVSVARKVFRENVDYKVSVALKESKANVVKKAKLANVGHRVSRVFKVQKGTLEIEDHREYRGLRENVDYRENVENRESQVSVVYRGFKEKKVTRAMTVIPLSREQTIGQNKKSLRLKNR